MLVFEHPLAQRILAQRSDLLPKAYEALFIYADSPNDQIGSSSPIDIYATHLFRAASYPNRCEESYYLKALKLALRSVGSWGG